MQMTDEKVIEWLRKIKEHCKKLSASEGCGQCKFFYLKNGRPYCQFRMLAGQFCLSPKNWSMEEIERIIRL